MAGGVQMSILSLPFRAMARAGKWAGRGYRMAGSEGRSEMFDEMRKTMGKLPGQINDLPANVSKVARQFSEDNFGRYAKRFGGFNKKTGAYRSQAGRAFGYALGVPTAAWNGLVSMPIEAASQIASSAIGAAVGIPLAAGAAGMRLAGKAGWGLTKRMAKGNGGGGRMALNVAKGAGYTALGTAKVAANVAHGAAYEGLKAGHTAYQAGKFMWNMRDNSLFQGAAFLGIMGGAVMAGGARGEKDAYNGQTNYDPYAGNAFINETPNRGPVENRNKLDNFGATGDLVFALNNMRSGGML